MVLIAWSLFSYFFSSNPLKNSALFLLLEQGLHVSIWDKNNTSIYKIDINPSHILPAKDIPQILKDAVLANIFILNNNNPNCSPNLSLDTQLDNKCNYVYIDVLIKNYVLNNIIKSNLERGDTSTDLYYKLKYYLALKWLKKNFSMDKFITFLLNYSYYDNGILGIKEAANSYLGKDLTINKNITPVEAAFLTEKLFSNIGVICKNSDIQYKNVNVETILATMYDLGYIDKISEQNKIISDEPISKNTNVYNHFNNDIFKLALPLTTITNNIYVYTTLDKNLQYSLNEYLVGVSKKYNIKDIAVYGVYNGDIATLLNISMENNKAFYNIKIPTIVAKDLLKPLLYTGLFENNINVPPALLNNNIQNVINIKKFNPNELMKIFPSFSEKNNLMIDSINQNNSEKNSLYDILSQLVNLETQLFNKLSNKDLDNLSKEFHLPDNSLTKQAEQITLKATLDNIVNSFAILNQEGKYYNPVYICKLNDQKIYNNKEVNTFISPNNINKAMNLITYELYDNKKYKVLFDSNIALIYYNNYTIGIYISNPTSSKENNYSILKELTSYVIQNLV